MTATGISVGATWGTAGELLSFNGDTRSYNVLGQVTRITGGGMDMEYRYVAGQNNGRIWQSKDWATGEEVTYTYDTVNRATKAAGLYDVVHLTFFTVETAADGSKYHMPTRVPPRVTS